MSDPLEQALDTLRLLTQRLVPVEHLGYLFVGDVNVVEVAADPSPTLTLEMGQTHQYS